MPEWYYTALLVLSSSTSTLDTSHLQVIPSLINMACFGFACYWLNRKIFQCTLRFCIQPWSSQARHSQPNFDQSICAVPPQISNIIINANIIFPMTFILCSILFFLHTSILIFLDHYIYTAFKIISTSSHVLLWPMNAVHNNNYY